MRTPFTPAHAKALTILLLAIRPDWTKSYTEAAVGNMRLIDDDLEHIIRAAIRGALSPSIRKPDVLAMTGNHWQAIADDPRENGVTAKAARCDDCHGIHPWNAPHQPAEHQIAGDITGHLKAARLAVNAKKPRTYAKETTP